MNNIQFISHLLQVVHNDWTLLMKACYEGWDEIVQFLVNNHPNTININQQDQVR